jgi:hypothetical protein
VQGGGSGDGGVHDVGIGKVTEFEDFLVVFRDVERLAQLQHDVNDGSVTEEAGALENAYKNKSCGNQWARG